jgi:hypothetical protein
MQHNEDIVPIEVTSGRRGQSKSLAEYLKRYSLRGEPQTVPLYMLWNIGNLPQ